MLGKMHFYLRVLGLMAARRLIEPEAIAADYDRLSNAYDEYFSRHVARHSLGLVRELAVQPGMRALDLACGTGTLTLALAQATGENGEVVGVDHSAGMLARAEAGGRQRRLGNVRFLKADMREGLDRFSDGSMDRITCGWAIGYVAPVDVLRAAGAKLKPGGRLGIIENARGTLAPIRQTAVKVAQEFPGKLQGLMDLHFRLPKDKEDLWRLFGDAGLRPLKTWEGRETFVFERGADVLNWVLHTGASAGFDRMMAPDVREQCDQAFVRILERDHKRDGRIRVAHRFVAGMAEREA